MTFELHRHGHGHESVIGTWTVDGGPPAKNSEKKTQNKSKNVSKVKRNWLDCSGQTAQHCDHEVCSNSIF